MPELWAGTDAGKAAHHCTVIDTDGTKMLSRRVPNNEPELLELISDVLALAEDSPVTWAVDLNAGGGALLIALLVGHGQRLLYIPGRTVHHASRGYRGDGKTDAKDAYVIADQARMRRDLQPLQEWDEIAVDLKILTARRYDLAADRTRAINRMRAQLLEYFPALERAFDYAASKAALVLLTGYQTPAGLRRLGPSRLAAWLKNRNGHLAVGGRTVRTGQLPDALAHFGPCRADRCQDFRSGPRQGHRSGGRPSDRRPPARTPPARPAASPRQPGSPRPGPSRVPCPGGSCTDKARPVACATAPVPLI